LKIANAAIEEIASRGSQRTAEPAATPDSEASQGATGGERKNGFMG